MIATWKLLLGLTVVLVIYGFGVVVLGAPASVSGFLVLVVSAAIGIGGGWFISNRIFDEE
ncbi:MAG: hypothetical protein ABEH56_05270 [Salinirussus sp.]